jgi:hypothetical protein
MEKLYRPATKLVEDEGGLLGMVGMRRKRGKNLALKKLGENILKRREQRLARFVQPLETLQSKFMKEQFRERNLTPFQKEERDKERVRLEAEKLAKEKVVPESLARLERLLDELPRDLATRITNVLLPPGSVPPTPGVGVPPAPAPAPPATAVVLTPFAAGTKEKFVQDRLVEAIDKRLAFRSEKELVDYLRDELRSQPGLGRKLPTNLRDFVQNVEDAQNANLNIFGKRGDSINTAVAGRGLKKLERRVGRPRKMKASSSFGL